jgi:hypothetical protein
MTVFDVLVNTDDLVVLGPPEVVELAVSIGEQGVRGATFFVGSGNPNDPVIFDNVFGDEITPVEGDVYINTATGVEYGWLYIYNPKNEETEDDWDEVLRLQQPFYSRQLPASFSSGTATVSIPLTQILIPGFTQSDVSKYIINVTPISNNPVCMSVSSKTISGSNFQFVLRATEFNGSWSNLNSSISVMVNISVVV